MKNFELRKMKSKEDLSRLRVQGIRRHVLQWYRRNRRALPWRENPTPYRVWISEVMLQQTQVNTVIPYYRRFLERFPTLESLSQASERDVMKLWAGLGYYGRARNILRAARLIVRQYGTFPNDFASILALPGVGEYTAAAICSLAFNQPRPLVDGNIRRVIARLEGIQGHVTERYYWDKMSNWISKRSPSDFNQAMMELGATVCVPKSPLCSRCPVEHFCKARKLGIQREIPLKATRLASLRHHVVLLVLEKQSRILISKEEKPRMIPGQWGLPCAAIIKGNSPGDSAAALCRRIIGNAFHLEPRGTFTHNITRYRITAHLFYGRHDSRMVVRSNEATYRWIDPAEFDRFLASSIYKKAIMKCGLAGNRQ